MDHKEPDYPEGGFTGGLEDYVLPFHLEGAGAKGRLVRMGPAIDTILSQHNYPEPVSALLGEAVALTALLGAALKFEGKLILQTRSEGPVKFLVVHYDEPGKVRGYANFDAQSLAAAGRGAAPGSGGLSSAELLGEGHLAMTIDPGAGKERYQGVVAIKSTNLTGAALVYFDQSEQIPTFLKIAVARQYVGGGLAKPNGRAGGVKPGVWKWRAGGVLVQKLPGDGEGGLDLSGEEDWRRAEALASTVEDHELLDPTLPPDRLLYRLFHEERVRAFKAKPLQAHCQCSKARVAELLRSFSREEIEDMVKDGVITVTCEFCNSHYEFKAVEFLD
jgi:molecular chaperone Hsp33